MKQIRNKALDILEENYIKKLDDKYFIKMRTFV